MITLTLIFLLLLIVAMIGLIFGCIELILKIVFTVIIALPLAAVLASLGLLCCCTLILIPLGVLLFKLAFGALTLAF